jgi:hypothetical protein
MRCLRRLLAPLLLALSLTAASSPSSAGLYVSVALAPPALPVYELPRIPGPNYIWAPGYWAYAEDVDDYYWVPGTWVRAPRVGLLWTPGYWGWSEGYYVWHAGYWGPHIGYYGGICYGHGYYGAGYAGGHWNHGAFFYNTAVVRVNTAVIQNTYNKTVINNTTITNVSYNGGAGGTTAKASAAEIAAEHEHHEAATGQQVQHEHTASKDGSLFSKANHGSPKLASISSPSKLQQHIAAKHDTGQTTTGSLHDKQVGHDPDNASVQGSKQTAHLQQKTGQHVQHSPHVQQHVQHPHPKGKDQHG